MDQARPESDATPFSYLGVFNVLWRNKVRIVLLIVLFAILGIALSFVMVPVYRAEVVVSPVVEGRASNLSSLTGELSGLATIAGISLPSNSNDAVEAIALLRSRDFGTRFIRDEDLLPVFYPESWDAETGQWKGGADDDAPSLYQAYDYFRENILLIVEDKTTGLVTLSIDWRDRDEAARWANLFIERANQQTREKHISEAQRSIDYLNSELGKTNIVGLQQAIYGLIEEQISHIMLANVRDQYSFSVIDPAVVPDKDKFVSPNRLYILALSILFGFFIGAIWAFARDDEDRAATS